MKIQIVNDAKERKVEEREREREMEEAKVEELKKGC